MIEHEQLVLDVDQVATDAAAGDDFGAWLRSLPPAPWLRDDEESES